MLNSRKRIVVSLSVLAFVFLALLGVSYAYYAANITGNTSETPSLSLRSGYLAITYTDGTSKITGGSSSGATNDLVYTKTFSVKNSGVADTYYGVSIKNYKVTDASGNATTFERPVDWIYELKTGDTVISSGVFPIQDEVLISSRTIATGETEDLTLTVTYKYSQTEIQTADMNKSLEFDVVVIQSDSILDNAAEGTLLFAINRDNEVKDPVTLPGRTAASESILASTEDDYGTSYYFRGNVQNNFVTFAGMCWRIVRIDGNGNIKIVLADRDHVCGADPDEYDSTFPVYDSRNSYSSFVANPDEQRFPYSKTLSQDVLTFANSDIAKVLDAWVNGKTYEYYDLNSSSYVQDTFKQYISDENQKKLVEAEWCNDTSLSSKLFFDSTGSIIVGSNTSLITSTTYQYGAKNRIENIETAKPSLKCNFKGIDGTTATKYPSVIGTLTVDEIAFAGESYLNGASYKSYLETNASLYYWTMSPTHFTDEYNTAVVYINGNEIDFNIVTGAQNTSIRPAVVLRRDVPITGGNGEQTTPYVIN